jgi:hypothetical protein
MSLQVDSDRHIGSYISPQQHEKNLGDLHRLIEQLYPKGIPEIPISNPAPESIPNPIKKHFANTPTALIATFLAWSATWGNLEANHIVTENGLKVAGILTGYSVIRLLKDGLREK